LAGDDRLRVHVHLDERSAAFFALGLAKADRRPVIVLSTSGTAPAHFHPAVLEAHHGRVPLVVCSADRPPELRDTGAGQTIDQVGLYGGAVRWACDVEAPADRPGAGATWRAIAARAAAAATGPPPGPVHLNLAFREPLVATGAPPVAAPGRADGRPWVAVTASAAPADDATVDRLAALVARSRRGMLVAGWGASVSEETAARFAGACGWPVLADPISGLRVGGHAVSTYEALLRVPGFADAHRPDLVLRVGAPPTSKLLGGWLDSAVPQIVVDPDRAWLDPARAAAEIVLADAEPLLVALADRLPGPAPPDGAWLAGWQAAEAAARAALDAALDGDPQSECRVARDLVAGLPDGATLLVASSMPVRDVESFAAPRAGLRFLANRGVNGIDGLVSTVLGAAASPGAGPVVGLLGDLAFLHDVGGLASPAARAVDATFVVIDNDGGGIFSFLPQAQLLDPDGAHFEALFGTPHGLDLATMAAAYGAHAVRADDATVLQSVAAAIAAGGVQMVLVRSDRPAHVSRHEAAWQAVARSVAPLNPT